MTRPVTRTAAPYRLPEDLRARLQRPLAPVVDEAGLLELDRAGRLGRPLACVGDMVCETLLRLGIEPKILVYDLVTLRGAVPDAVREALTGRSDRLVRVRNPPGEITEQLERAVKDAFAHEAPTRIQVDGEEDLAGLPVLRHAPQGATMIYGMPNQGLVPVPVTDENRAKAEMFLSLMKVGSEQEPDPTEGG